ncbi:MAG: alpha/beta hydrolase-fold protein [bacterium]
MHKNFIRVIFLSFLMMNVIYPQKDSVKINFEVTTRNLKIDESVFIAGGHNKLGNWNAGEVGLNKLNDSLWATAIYFEVGSNLEFKFTKGSWENEAMREDGSIPQNYSLLVNMDTTLSFTISKWRDEVVVQTKGQITGTVEYHRKFTWGKLLPRDIIVWLPPDYYKYELSRYPVLYMHDGQNIIDPATSSFGVDWMIDETADSLIRIGEVEPMIIVGIYNTSHRTPEYTHGDTGREYMEFIVKKLKPFIDENYRTFHDRKHTFTAGSSLGGLISFMLAWEYPEVFIGAACFSPAFKIKELDYVQFVARYEGPKKMIKFYIDNGGIGLEAALQPGIDEMLLALKSQGYIEGRDFTWVKDSTALHTETAWAERTWRPLKLFFGKNFFEDGLNMMPPDEWRFRVTCGKSYVLNDKDFFWHLNLNSRYTPFSVDTSILRLHMTMEHGLNVGFLDDGLPWVLYYGKAGPELRLFDNYFLEAHFGLGGGMFFQYLTPIFFWGGETGYILPLREDLSVEFEFGINRLYDYAFFYYFIAGISF